MKVPEPRKLPSNNYNVRMRLGGESISITYPDPDRCKQEAQLIKAQYLAGLRQQVPKAVKDTTLNEAVSNYIKANEKVLSPSTVRSYNSYLNNRFSSCMKKKLPEINYQSMISDELENASEKTVKNAWSMVHASLVYAGYPVPKVRLAKVPVKEVTFLQPEEIKPFCAAVQGKSYEIACLLMLHGLRLSEVKGLRWEDIDLKKKVITVNGAVVRGPDGLTRKKTNKTKSSTRKVPIMIPRLYEAINGHRSTFERSVGIHPSVLLEDVKSACKRAGTTVCSCHDLRRSFASLCYHLRDSVSERQCMAWGGWSDYATMHRVYVQLAASDENKARQAMEEFFKTPTKMPTENQKG